MLLMVISYFSIIIEYEAVRKYLFIIGDWINIIMLFVRDVDMCEPLLQAIFRYVTIAMLYVATFTCILYERITNFVQFLPCTHMTK